jgi:hypothetical protein
MLPVSDFWPPFPLPECWVKLYIVRKATLYSLLSILRLPLEWYLDDGSSCQSCVHGVTYINVASGATFIIGNPPRFKSFWNSYLKVNISKEENQGVAQSGQIAKSLEAIREMMLPPGHSEDLRRVEIHIEDRKSEDPKVWIDEVSEIRARLDRSS